MKKTKVIPIFKNDELDPAYWVVMVFQGKRSNAFGPFENSGMASSVKQTLDKIIELEELTVHNYNEKTDSKLVDEFMNFSFGTS